MGFPGRRQQEQGIGELTGPVLLSQLAAATTLGYLDFRLPELEWRNACPNTAERLPNMESRPSLQSTRPPAH